jgi:hypothetical protein
VSYYDDDPIEKSGSRNSIFSSILALVVLLAGGGFYLSSTLAANITLSSGGTVEFGQGVSQAVACSGATNLLVTPASTFANAENGTGTHYLGAIKVSNIPNSCYGVDFTIRAFGPSSSTPLALFNATSTDAIVYNNNGTFGVNPLSSGISISSGTGTFTVNFTAPVSTSTSVAKVTIQSSTHTQFCNEAASGCLGQTGPAGGTIFITNTFLGGSGGSYNYEAWTSDLSSSLMVWNNVSGILGVGTAIGDGYTNRNLFTGGAGLGCKNATYAGFNDWFLPSDLELRALRTFWGNSGKTSPTNMRDTGYGYWSSSENGAANAVAIRWNDGMPYGDAYAGKTGTNNTGWARCVRRF